MKLNEIHNWGGDDDYSIDSPSVSAKVSRLSRSGASAPLDPPKKKSKKVKSLDSWEQSQYNKRMMTREKLDSFNELIAQGDKLNLWWFKVGKILGLYDPYGGTLQQKRLYWKMELLIQEYYGSERATKDAITMWDLEALQTAYQQRKDAAQKINEDLTKLGIEIS